VAYEVKFAASVKRQLQDLAAHERALVLEAVEVQLVHEPRVETTNRKPLRPNPVPPRGAPRRPPADLLRGERRDAANVDILAVGRKDGNILRIAGEEIKL
jgi:hypothetical protein